MKKDKLSILTAVFIFAFVVSPFLYLNKNSYITIHDNLDGELVYYHILKISDLLFSLNGETIVPNVMNGIPRSCFHSEFSFIRLLFYIFPSFWAYVINLVIIRLIGFVGMYLLAKNYLIKDTNQKIISVFAALFSIIPIYPLYGLSVLGQPLLIWAFLNLSNNNKSAQNWLIILLYPFYSHFAMIAPFILLTLASYGIYRLLIKKEKINQYYFIGLGTLFISFIIANLTTLHSFLFSKGYTSHRSEWITEQHSLAFAVKQFFYTLIKGQYHSSSFIAIPIYIFALITLFYIIKERRKIATIAKPVILIGIIVLFEVVYQFIKFSIQNSIHILTAFQFDRFTFLIPLLWFIILGISIRYTINRIRMQFLYIVIILQALLIIWSNDEIKLNYEKIFFSKNNSDKIPSFQSFFATDMFSQISKFINKPKNEYRVVSIGIHPSIAQYNGFYTLDGYQNNYPLDYKKRFRKIIIKEIEKDTHIKKYFDEWGSRCYVFSHELKDCGYFNCSKSNIYADKDFTKQMKPQLSERNNPGSESDSTIKAEDLVLSKTKEVKHKLIQIDSLEINTLALKELGGQYIFSAVPIKNYSELQLSFLKKFSNKNAMWDIYLYKLLKKEEL